jgi:hypothetical protein
VLDISGNMNVVYPDGLSGGVYVSKVLIVIQELGASLFCRGLAVLAGEL